jgi:hypothetical protein
MAAAAPLWETPLAAEAVDFRDRARRVAVAEIAPSAPSVDARARFPAEQVQALAAAGLGCIPVATALGGSGGSTLAYAAALEEVAAACGSTSTVYMTQLHCVHPIAIAGSEEQKARLIPPVCGASAYGSLAVSEPDAGSDVAAMRTVARRDGDGYVINGSKTFISNADEAAVMVLFATVDPGLGRKGVTAFVLERDRDEFTVSPPMKKLGMKGASTCEVTFEDCRIPVAARMGDEGAGFAISMEAVVTSRISAAAQGVGFARAAFEGALRWARERSLLADPAAQAVQFHLAEMRTKVAASRALLQAVASQVDSTAGDKTAVVSLAKLHCTGTAVEVATAAVGLMGGDGDLIENGVERVFRDAKVTEIYDGTNQIQRMLIARDLRYRKAAVRG